MRKDGAPAEPGGNSLVWEVRCRIAIAPSADRRVGRSSDRRPEFSTSRCGAVVVGVHQHNTHGGRPSAQVRISIVRSSDTAPMTFSLFRCLPLITLCASCAPAIYTFHVTPNRICAGDRVTFDWNASKAGTISAKPEQPAPGAVPRTGTASVVPTSSVRYQLKVSNLWGSAARDNDVELLAGRTLPIGNSVADPAHPATCTDSTLSVTAVTPASAWSDRAIVGRVTTLAEDPHRYYIEHAGVKVELAPGQVSQAFQGTPVAGEWLLSVTLLGDERCRTPTVPRNLGIQLVAACNRGMP